MNSSCSDNKYLLITKGGEEQELPGSPAALGLHMGVIYSSLSDRWLKHRSLFQGSRSPTETLSLNDSNYNAEPLSYSSPARHFRLLSINTQTHLPTSLGSYSAVGPDPGGTFLRIRFQCLLRSESVEQPEQTKWAPENLEAEEKQRNTFQIVQCQHTTKNRFDRNNRLFLH